MKPHSITEEGVYDLPDEFYHADLLCPTPTLSSSIGKIMIEKTAAKAWMEHPRLNPNHEPTNRKIFDLGSAAHALILGEPNKVKVLPHKDYRTDLAKNDRDWAYANGIIPILDKDWAEVQEMSRVCRLQLDRHTEAFGAFRDGKPEQTMVWREDNGVVCRAKLDWLPNKIGNVWYDYKSTGVDAGPFDWGKRQMFDTAVDFQDAFYCRGFKKLFGVEFPQLHFVVQENKAPYALAVHAVQPMAREQANEAVEEAIDYWAWCLKHRAWPGWSKRTYYNDAPPWHSTARTERKVAREMAVQEKRDLYAELTHWQSPTATKGSTE